MHLGLTDAEFLALTPHQYYLLMDAHWEQVEHSRLLAGTIAATVANWSFHVPKKCLNAEDFLPSNTIQNEKPERARRINRKQVAADVRAWANRYKASYNG